MTDLIGAEKAVSTGRKIKTRITNDTRSTDTRAVDEKIDLGQRPARDRDHEIEKDHTNNLVEVGETIDTAGVEAHRVADIVVVGALRLIDIHLIRNQSRSLLLLRKQEQSWSG